MTVILNYSKLDLNLPDLKYAYESDCCFDLISAIDIMIYPHETKPTKVPTGMKFQIEDGWELQIRPRSGLAAKYGITVFNSPGTIDSNFVNEVQVLLINIGDDPFPIKKGERIAQAKLSKKHHVILKQVDKIVEKGRGLNGLGSTGTK